MAITQAIANNFKKLLLEGDSNFKQTGGDKYKLALYTSSATLNSATTSLLTSAPTNEVTSSNYSAGGGALVNNPTSLTCLLYTSPSPRDVEESRMPASA